MTWDGQERRSKKRYGVRKSTVRYRRGGMFSALRAPSPPYLLINVSESGCHFITKERLESGEKITLTLDAPKVPEPIRVRGEVVWSRESKEVGACRTGVRFTSVGARARDLIKNMLDNAILKNVDARTTQVELKEAEKL